MMPQPRKAGKLRKAGRCSAFLALTLALVWCLPLAAYYPFLHWRTINGSAVAVPERFDLRQLPGGEVPVVITRKGVPQFAERDGWEALLSEVQLAADSWSRVPNSSLRLVVAGETSDDPATAAPHIQVLFQDLPPGVIGMGGPVETGSIAVEGPELFVPIRKSLVVLNTDFRNRPTYGEAFFLTVMHELGHAIGLQHTFTSSVMSTGTTRSTTKSAPLAADDHAGVAYLYPGKYLQAETGVIQGRVTMEGSPVHFAPVTALLPSGEAVSAISLPDGSYEIRGLPPGQYYVYTQAAPPSSQDGLGPGQIVLPRDASGASVPPGRTFATRFYPGVVDWNAAFLVDVQPGQHTRGIDIDVPPQSQSLLRGATTYSFPGTVAVNPAILNANDANRFLVAYGPGLVENGRKSPGLEVDSIGAWIWQDDVFAYPWATDFLQVGIRLHPFSATGPKSLVWKRAGDVAGDVDVYVQPAAFRLVGQSPPELKDVTLERDGDRDADTERLRVRGAELGAVDRYLMEGLPVTAVPGMNEGSAQTHGVLLPVPYTSDGRALALVALSRDAQSSLHLGAMPLFAPSRLATRGNVRLTPSLLPAGGELMVVLEADGPVFSGNRVRVDFGDPAVVVTHLWKQSSSRVVLNVAVSRDALPGAYPLGVWNDLAFYRPGAMLQVGAPAPSAFAAGWALADLATGGKGLYPGSLARLTNQASVFANQASAFANGITVLLGGLPLPADCASGAFCEFQVPPTVPLGLTTLSVRAPGFTELPVAVEILGQPPRILDAILSRKLSSSVSLGTSAHVRLTVSPPEGSTGARDLKVRVNGRSIPHLQVTKGLGANDPVSISFEIWVRGSTGDPAPLRLQAQWDGRVSAEYVVASPLP